MVMLFIFAVSNHHSGTYDSRQGQGPGIRLRETRAPLPVVPTWSQTHTYTLVHACKNTNILRAPWATGIVVFWHTGWGSVNYTAATLARSASKMNEPTCMSNYFPNYYYSLPLLTWIAAFNLILFKIPFFYTLNGSRRHLLQYKFVNYELKLN